MSPLRPGKYPCQVLTNTSWERFAHTCFASALPETWVGTAGPVVGAGGVTDVPPDDVHADASSATTTSRRREDPTGESANLTDASPKGAKGRSVPRNRGSVSRRVRTARARPPPRARRDRRARGRAARGVRWQVVPCGRSAGSRSLLPAAGGAEGEAGRGVPRGTVARCHGRYGEPRACGPDRCRPMALGRGVLHGHGGAHRVLRHGERAGGRGPEGHGTR